MDITLLTFWTKKHIDSILENHKVCNVLKTHITPNPFNSYEIRLTMILAVNHLYYQEKQ